MARPERFELPTTKFVAWYSIQLSYGRVLTFALSLNHRGGKRRSEKRNYSDSRAVRQLFFSDFLHCRVETFTFGDDCTSLEPAILAFCFTFGYTFTQKNCRSFGGAHLCATAAPCRLCFVWLSRTSALLQWVRARSAALAKRPHAKKKAAQGRLFQFMPIAISDRRRGSAWPDHPPWRRCRHAAAEAAAWSRWSSSTSLPADPERGQP